jgi:hypothetical protein
MDTYLVEKVMMDTARLFTNALLEAGKNTSTNKIDVKDAFKNVPARIDELRTPVTSFQN